MARKWASIYTIQSLRALTYLENLQALLTLKLYNIDSDIFFRQVN